MDNSIGCDDPQCKTSTFIDEETVTCGKGKLDDMGIWEFPCKLCEEFYNRLILEAKIAREAKRAKNG